MLLASLLGLSLAFTSADIGTTLVAKDMGAVEVNGLMRPLTDRPIAFTVARLTLGVVLPELAARKLDRSGHRRWAKGLRIFAVVLPAAAAAWNVRQIVRRGR